MKADTKRRSLRMCLGVALAAGVAGGPGLSEPVSGTAVAAGSPGAGLELRWRARVGVRPEYVLADDHGVVTVTRRGLTKATDSGGREEWSMRIPLAHDEPILFDTASLGEGLVVVPIDEARVVAIDRASGARRWEIEMPGIRATALGSGAGGSSLVGATDGAGGLRVLDATTGALRWEAVLGDFPPEAPPLPRLWFRRGLLVVAWFGDEGSHVAAFDASSGAPAWQHDASGYSTIPAVTSESVSLVENLAIDARDVISADVRALEVETGAQRWSRTLRSRGAFFPELAGAAGDGRVVVLDHRGTVRAFDEATGAEQWRRATGHLQVAAEPHAVGAVLALPVLGSRLLGISMATGAEAHVDALGAGQAAVTIEGVATAGPRLYVLVAHDSSGEGEVWAFDAASETG